MAQATERQAGAEPLAPKAGLAEGERRAAEQNAAIRLQGVRLTYANGKTDAVALGGVDLSIAGEQFVCVLGPSGCGKTSLLRVIAGYERVTEGEVTVFGRKHTAPHPEVGIVFQQANLFPWLTVRGNVEFGLKMAGLPKADRRALAMDHIGRVGLAAYASLLPHQLSGGMKQRTAIARTLATEPRIVLMDEPFAALDAITRETLQDQLRTIWSQTGKTIFFITHDVDEALLLSTRLLVMQGSPGRIVADLDNPLHAAGGSFALLRQHKQYAELRRQLVEMLKS
ncbi:ABC transporter ATP-binding protein [Paenibacillus hodogayensis]|uniref:ABC transporter ATP-binding protein n=1 Tax=Paenibacillus hodogayensis TaxID=279208 RepID=A0ABV5VTF2_9BACL